MNRDQRNPSLVRSRKRCEPGKQASPQVRGLMTPTTAFFLVTATSEPGKEAVQVRGVGKSPTTAPSLPQPRRRPSH